MATYTPVVDVNITIQTVSLAQAGFGTPIFMDAHTGTNDRVFSITSPDILIKDKVDGGYGMTTNQPAYKAALQYFAQNPSPEVVKIGRRAAQWIGAPSGFDSSAGNETTHTITIDIPHLDTPITEVITIAALTAETVQDYLLRVVNEINVVRTDLNPYVLASSDASNITITPVDVEEVFTVTIGTSSYSGAYSGFETAAASIAAIRDFDDDWYFLSTHDRTRQFVLDMAQVIQAANDTVAPDTPSVGKMYFHASGDSENISGTAGGASDTSLFWELSEQTYTRTVSLFHHTAETYANAANADYPECAYVGYNAPYNAGSVTWANLKLAGLGPSRVSNSQTARYLNTTEKQKLGIRNSNFIERDAGVNVTRFGLTAGNEWIDVIRGVDWLTSEVETAIKRLLFAQQGGKVPYTDQGIARIREVIQSALQSAVNIGFLSSYTLEVPLLSQILSDSQGVTDFQNRVLSKVSFVGFLAGAIHTVSVNGTVQAPTAEAAALA